MELTLDLGPVFVAKTVDQCLKEVARVEDADEKLSMLEDYVARLEEERRKVDGFRQALPLCFLLLTDAILKLKEEAMTVKKRKKSSWMESVHLWKNGDPSSCKSEQKQRSEEEDDRSTCENPIKKASGGSERKEEEKEVVSEITELCLMTPAAAPPPPERVKPPQPRQQPPPNKKQRRCWSAELHRMFVDVLEELGGPNDATPKQIRERMHVEGLTNDEVKSHLQKYRLHMRRQPDSSPDRANSVFKYGGNFNEGSIVLQSISSPPDPLAGTSHGSSNGVLKKANVCM